MHKAKATVTYGLSIKVKAPARLFRLFNGIPVVDIGNVELFKEGTPLFSIEFGEQFVEYVIKGLNTDRRRR